MGHSCASCSASAKPCRCNAESETAPRRSGYSFKEGLTMMAAKATGIDPYLAAEAGENARAALNAMRNAAKAKSPKDRAGFIRDAQNELRAISPARHGKLVNSMQAKLLALQGRGGDREIAHLTPGEVVIPRSLQTPGLMRAIAAEAERQGIDPARYTVGQRANRVNPQTGAREFSGCNPGDPGECNIPDFFTHSWPMDQVDVIGYVGNWPPTGVSFGNVPPPNFGDGAGGGGGAETSDILDFLRDPLCNRPNGEDSGMACCQRKGPPVEPNFGLRPSQAVLDGMNPNELERTAWGYDYLSDVASVASTFGDALGALRAARTIFGSAKIIIDLEDRFQQNPEALNPSEYLSGIATAYRNELERRGGAKCTELT
jgi:hypothetical protein